MNSKEVLFEELRQWEHYGNAGQALNEEAAEQVYGYAQSLVDLPEGEVLQDHHVGDVVQYLIDDDKLTELYDFAKWLQQTKHKCTHEPYGGTPYCGEMSCPNYANKHQVTS